MSQEKEPQGSEDTARSGFLDRWKSKDGRPSSFVYFVLGIGVLTLTILLGVIYFSASERERTSPPICTDISLARAQQVVLHGEVERMTVVYDDELRTPTSNRYGPVLAKLDYTDGTCSNLPQGVVNQEVVYTLSGVIGFYNQTTDGKKVEITYQRSDHLDDTLFQLPTETPTVTPSPEPSMTPSASPPVETPVPSGSPVGTGTPAAVASPAATPDVSVSATP